MGRFLGSQRVRGLLKYYGRELCQGRILSRPCAAALVEVQVADALRLAGSCKSVLNKLICAASGQSAHRSPSVVSPTNHSTRFLALSPSLPRHLASFPPSTHIPVVSYPTLHRAIRSAAILLTSSAPRYYPQTPTLHVLQRAYYSGCMSDGIYSSHSCPALTPVPVSRAQPQPHAHRHGHMLGACWARRGPPSQRRVGVGAPVGLRAEIKHNSWDLIWQTDWNRSTARQSGAGGPLLTDRDSVVPGSLPTIRVVVVNLSSAGEVSAMPLSYPVLQLRYLCCCSTAGRLESTESMLTRSRVFG